MAYTIVLTDDEMGALNWIADRYLSAKILVDGATEDWGEDTDAFESDEVTLTIPEHVAWDYAEMLEEEDYGLVPPCCGPTLADKLLRFWESIV